MPRTAGTAVDGGVGTAADWFDCFGCRVCGEHAGGQANSALESPCFGASIPPRITQFGPLVAEI
jgi:hypothetical protein